MILTGYDGLVGITKKAQARVDDIRIDLINQRNQNYSNKKKWYIKSIIFEQAYGITGWEVRSIVAYWRLRGEAIASDKNGYFMAFSSSELDNTVHHMDERCSKIARVSRSLKQTQRHLEQTQGDLF